MKDQHQYKKLNTKGNVQFSKEDYKLKDELKSKTNGKRVKEKEKGGRKRNPNKLFGPIYITNEKLT